MPALPARHNEHLQVNNTIHGILLQMSHLLPRTSTQSAECTVENKTEDGNYGNSALACDFVLEGFQLCVSVFTKDDIAT
ncbi:unnamed protein product [Albugo candida]|uniref:Uncharacterized protein n=1 Tax=Albugo candida TaxID=65357 RepID=A0A024FX74_9STRA|nr:unnamed protein product [Albugo candida]|eukprot:CCI11788.1 unnamed protein product [Albugo candida]